MIERASLELTGCLQKVPKYLKLPAKHIEKLKRLVAAGKFKDQTSAIEAAIERL